MERNNYQIINNYLLDLQKVDSLEKMDDFVATLTNALDQIYPSISCKTGCFTCCTGPSMPNVYAKEWQRVREYIKQMPEETRNAIKDKANNLYNEHSDVLNFVDEILHQKITSVQLGDFAQRVTQELKCASCPLHIDGKCSVYPVRPTKCRIFGYFGFIFENKLQMLTCVSDTIKMKEYLEKNKTTQVVLPYWNYFERKLINFVLDDSEKHEMTIIPIWLKEDIDSGKL